MSLILISEPQSLLPTEASQLSQGTWFIDKYGQIHVLVLDDRTTEKRVVCVGDYCPPFIPNIPPSFIEVDHILPLGTMLEITSTAPLLTGR